MKTHLSQSIGVGTFDGQHGISLAISSIVSADMSDDAMAGGAITSAIISCDACEDVAAITGREAGASAKPAIIRIASNRRMVKFRFTTQISHKRAAMGSSSFAYHEFHRPLLIGIKLSSPP